MTQQTALQEFIAWGDEMLLIHPQKLLSFGEAIDKAVSLLEKEKAQIIHAWENGALPDLLKEYKNSRTYYEETYKKIK